MTISATNIVYARSDEVRSLNLAFDPSLMNDSQKYYLIRLDGGLVRRLREFIRRP